MNRSYSEFAKILRDATNNSIELFRDKSSYPKPNAQANLEGRTHYVDDGSLRFHSARIISARHYMDGALFVIIESTALDMYNTKRGFRFVAFDIFGNVIERPKLDESFRTSEQARKARDKWFAGFDVESYYRQTLSDRAKRLERETAALKDGVAILSAPTEKAA